MYTLRMVQDAVTSGYITLHNLSKFWDYSFLFVVLVLAVVAQIINKKYQVVTTKKFEAESIEIAIPLAIVLVYVTCVIGLTYGISDLPIFATSAALGIFIHQNRTKLSEHQKLDESHTILALIALAALNLKIATTGGNAIIYALMNMLFAIILYTKGIVYTLGLLSIILFKTIDFGQYIVNDLFHSAEFFVSTHNGLNEKNIWNVFPNIGYLEDYIPNIIVRAFSVGQDAFLTPKDAYSIATVLSLLLVYDGVYRKSPRLALGLTFVLPAERMTLVLATGIAVLVSRVKSAPTSWFLLGASLPFILIGLSPSYGVVIFFAACIMYSEQPPNRLGHFLLISGGLLSTITLSSQLTHYLAVYQSWGEVNTAAHGTLLFESNWMKNIFRSIFIGLLFFNLTNSIFERNKNQFLYFVKIIGLTVALWIYGNYAITRIDSDISTRIFPLGVSLLVVTVMNARIYNSSIKYFFASAIIGSCLANPQSLFKAHTEAVNSFALTSENSEILKNYEDFMGANQISKAIIFGNSPAISLVNSSFILPPYSSPWVSIGQTPQTETIQFLVKNQDLPIIFGKDYKTWDGIDTRARSPYIYKFIGKNYKEVHSNGLIGAIPSKSRIEQNVIFSNFDIGKTSEFYRLNNKILKTQVKAACPDSEKKWAKFKINNEYNFFYATLICGENLIPSAYLDGQFLSAEFVEYK
jgi:hypothetical protein